MMNRWRTLAFVLTTLWLGIATGVVAQGPPAPDDDGPPRLNLLDELPGVFPGADSGPKIFLAARFELEAGTNAGRLQVTAEPAPGWHFYSMTQPSGGPLPSKLTVLPSSKFRLAGPFTADTAPEIHVSDLFAVKPLNLEEHHKPVVWSAPLELSPDVDPQTLTIGLQFDGQVCKESCINVEEQLEAKFAGFYTLAKPTGEFEAESKHVTWKAHVEPQVATPGSTVKLVFTGTPVEPYHLYAYEVKNETTGYMPTLVALRPLPEGWKQVAAVTSAPVKSKPNPVDEGAEILYHEGPVTWTIELKIPESQQAGKVELSGVLGFQTCTDETCDLPAAAKFQVTLPIDQQATPGQALLAFEPALYQEAEELAAASAPSVEIPLVVQPFTYSGLLTAMGLALLGGLILNVMPCVLPVIPLKLLSIVEQAGKSRAKIIGYNLVYAVGTVSVFVLLGIASVAMGLSWGEQFAVTEFQIVVTLFMFAMTLSLLGVWEISLPDAVGSGETVSSEGSNNWSGAFWKGMMTTVYATPCTGPFLGIALGATLGFPVYASLLVFFAAGLGFASPYIVFGLLMAQSPSVARLIPRPGVWMEHVKQGLGFLLLAIVVWWYFPLIDPGYHMATLFAAIGVALACWIIGKVPPYAERRAKLSAWGGALATVAVVSWVAFSYLGPMNKVKSILPWQPYSAEALAQAQSEGKTVMIDFTADWCPNCKVNLALAIDTNAVNEVVQKNDVVVLLADWTDRGETIKRKLNELQMTAIPVLAVYPAGSKKPIVLDGIVFQSQVVGALEKAGPSRTITDDSGEAVALSEPSTR